MHPSMELGEGISLVCPVDSVIREGGDASFWSSSSLETKVWPGYDDQLGSYLDARARKR